MRTTRTTERRVIGALLLTALLPLVTAMLLANAAIHRVSDAAFQPAFREQLARSLDLYRDLARSMRRAMEGEATAIAARRDMLNALGEQDEAAAQRVLEQVAREHPSLVTLTTSHADGSQRVQVTRSPPLDPETEQRFTVERRLDGAALGHTLVLEFAVDRRRFDDATAAREFASAYESLESAYADATSGREFAARFAALLGLTVVLSVVVGARVVRPVTREFERILAATRPVAAGDLSVRLAPSATGEFAELTSAFNRMLEELDHSRARIEFLRRVGQWQTVARRLAHEIKNPLTPIQLAVDECCQRYRGDDEGYRALLATTRDIVTEEVAALRTLVGEFASFARLPRAHLRPGDLRELLREQWPRLQRDELPTPGGREVRLELHLGEEPLPVAFDRTLLHRVLVNLIANASQATGTVPGDGDGHVWVGATRTADHCIITVEDDGPGVADVLKGAIFDPYVTTKKTGTGLGLSIVQKVVLDHGGTVEVENREGGGARFRVRLPILGTGPSDAAMSKSHASAWDTSASQPGGE